MSGKRILKALAFSYGIFFGGNWVSNHIIHPTQKLDYGFLNPLLGRPVYNKWWNTKTEHICTIAIPLAITDVAIVQLLTKIYGPLKWSRTPGCCLFHIVFFAVFGIAAYATWQSYMNPTLDPAKRKEYLINHICPIVAGSCTQAWVPWAFELMARPMNATFPLGFVFHFGPVGLAFAGVKGFGFQDHTTRSLTEFERYLNGIREDIPPKKEYF